MNYYVENVMLFILASVCWYGGYISAITGNYFSGIIILILLGVSEVLLAYYQTKREVKQNGSR